MPISRDLVCGCMMLAVAVVYYLLAAAIPASMLSDAVGPQGLPQSYAIALGLLSALLIGKSVLAARGGRGGSAATGADSRRDRVAALRAIGMLALGAGYVLLLPWLGYIVSLALLIGSAAWYQERARHRWLVPVAVLGGLLFWLIFVQVLQVPEPAGLWPSFV